ncbi:MAG: hypothetical protein IKZ08_02560 [Bacteroidales bacterium]|nr:hypothetical protein [Bacteroidales bacterium]
MRTLKFIVDGQIITKDPDCDFENLVPGTVGYLKAEFTFSPEWKNFVKVAAFWQKDVEYPPQILMDGKSCMIPAEALVNRIFEVQILGRQGDLILPTNRVKVYQNGGKT